MKNILAALLCFTLLFSVPVHADSRGFLFPPSGTEKEDEEVTVAEETAAEETTAEETAIKEPAAPEPAAQEPGAIVYSEREKAHLTAGGGFLAELNGRTWCADSTGVFALENGVEVARFAGSYTGICSFDGSLLLMRDDSAEDSTGKIVTTLMRLDPSDGTMTCLYEFPPSSSSTYFLTVARDSVWISSRNALLTLGADGQMRPTPYQNVYYITEKGIYLPEAQEDGTWLGLLYVSFEDPSSAFSYPELSGIPVNTCFSLDGRLYLMAGSKPGWVELDGSDTTLHSFPVEISWPDETNIITNYTYWSSPSETSLLFAVSTLDPQSMFRHHLCRYTPSTGAFEELASTGSGFPLCWPSVSGDILYASDLLNTFPVFDLATGELLISESRIDEPQAPAGTEIETKPNADDLSSHVYRVGISADYPPFQYYDEDNNIVGFEIDLLQSICEYYGCEYELVEMPFDELLISLENGSVDLVIAGISATEERKERYDFTIPYYSEYDPEWDETFEYAIALPKGSPLLSYLNEAIENMEENGYLNVLRWDWELS